MEKVVTDIEKYKRGKYKVFINDEPAFVLCGDDIKICGLKKGGSVSPENMENIYDKVLKKRGRLYAMQLLERFDRTERDLRRKLKDSFYPEEIIGDIIDYVKKYKYLDDVRYACNYIRMCGEKYSSLELKRRLFEKGIREEDVEMAFYRSSDEGVLDENREDELIKKLILKKYPDPSYIDDASRDKLFVSLYRKGFAISRVEKVLDDIKVM